MTDTGRFDSGTHSHAGAPRAPRGQPERTGGARKVIAATTNTGHSLHPGDQGLVPLEELIRQTAGARPISSVDDLRCDAFETGEELDEFLAFVAGSRQANLA